MTPRLGARAQRPARRIPFGPLEEALKQRVLDMPHTEAPVRRRATCGTPSETLPVYHGLSSLLSAIDRQAVYRARRAGAISVDQVDRICVGVLGCHPAEIYGSLWWSQAPEDD